ncbi:GAP family protein [Aeromicrobium sp. UC242_57]|uniref:GAP family protein n=1 Tax=Aeromicrobium sp. UC242_57 TaxID=3374624 RepID=UPI00379DDDF7
MGALISALLPEIVGLIITPAAVVGAVLLLESRGGVRAAASFGAGFLVLYAVITLAAIIGGAANPGAQDDDVSAAIGIAVGCVFLAVGGLQLLRRPRPDAPPPGWIRHLDQAGPAVAFVIGVVMALVNPNLLILLSGIGVIASSDQSSLVSLVGLVALFVAAMLDFIVPIGLYVVLGDRARTALVHVKQWMLRHNRALSIAVLLGFGVLFLGRGLGSA